MIFIYSYILTYYLSISELMDLFRVDYIYKYVIDSGADVDEEFARSISEYAMKYLFWFEIYISGLGDAKEYLDTAFDYIDKTNPYYKLFFFYLFLTSSKFYKAVYVIYNIGQERIFKDFLFVPSDMFEIIVLRIRQIREMRQFVVDDATNQMIDDFHSKLFPEQQISSEPESVFVKLESPEMKRNRYS